MAETQHKMGTLGEVFDKFHLLKHLRPAEGHVESDNTVVPLSAEELEASEPQFAPHTSEEVDDPIEQEIEVTPVPPSPPEEATTYRPMTAEQEELYTRLYTKPPAELPVDVDTPTAAVDEPETEEPAKTPTTTQHDRARQARLDRLLAYANPDRHPELTLRYAGHSSFDLEQMAGIFEHVLGAADPDEQIQSINRDYLEHLADPKNRAAVAFLEAKGSKFLKVAADVARAINSDVVINSLTADEYQTAARDAIQNLGALKTMILALEPHLEFYLSAGEVTQAPDLKVPASMCHLMGLLKHTYAHLKASVTHSKITDENLRRITGDLEDARKKLAKTEGLLESTERRYARRYREVLTGTTLIYSTANNAFLAHPEAPDGRNRSGARMMLKEFFWTENPAIALSFASKQHARRAVDDIVLKSRIITQPGLKPQLAGQAIETLDFATPALRVPVRD